MSITDMDVANIVLILTEKAVLTLVEKLNKTHSTLLPYFFEIQKSNATKSSYVFQLRLNHK